MERARGESDPWREVSMGCHPSMSAAASRGPRRSRATRFNLQALHDFFLLPARAGGGVVCIRDSPLAHRRPRPPGSPSGSRCSSGHATRTESSRPGARAPVGAPALPPPEAAPSPMPAARVRAAASFGRRSCSYCSRASGGCRGCLGGWGTAAQGRSRHSTCRQLRRTRRTGWPGPS